MSNVKMSKILEQLKILIIVGIMILIGQRIGYGIGIIKAIPGIILVIIVAQISLIIKAAFPNIKFPAFAWATMISFILSMPFMPTAEWYLGITNNVNFLGTTTPILAFAGISVGNKLQILKKLSWKIVIVSIFVFLGTFFGSAVIAQIVLKIQGLI